MFGMYVVDQNGRVLTVIYRKNAEKSALYSSWWGLIRQVLTAYEENLYQKWYNVLKGTI